MFKKLITLIQIVWRKIWFRILSIFPTTPVMWRDQAKTVDCEFFNRAAYSSTIGRADVLEPAKCLPRTKGRWIFGTVFELIAAGGAPNLHQYIDRRHAIHGPIFAERLFGAPEAVFVASATLMRSVFLYEGQSPRHPVPESWTLYNRHYNCQRGLFFMEGTEWLHNRRILNRLLLNGNLDWMDRHMEACTEQLVSTWRQQTIDGKPVADAANYVSISDLEHQLYLWSINVICSIMFGSQNNSKSHSYPEHITIALAQFARHVHKIFESSSALMQIPPWLAKLLHLRVWKEFEQSVSQVLDKGAQIIELLLVHQASADEKSKQDTLCYKLQEAGMPLPMIKRIFVDLVIAAGDTTAYTLEWALYVLAQHPDLQEQLASEVYLAKGDTKRFDLVRGLLRETLRLYPVAPFVGRYLATDAVIGGYSIKKNTLILLSLHTSGRDAKHFPQPLKVCPERWQRNEQTGQLAGVTEAHGTLPFAIGNRSCIGRKLALNQMQSFIAAIVQNFHLVCKNTTPIDTKLRLVTVPSHPLQLALKLREQWTDPGEH